MQIEHTSRQSLQFDEICGMSLFLLTVFFLDPVPQSVIPQMAQKSDDPERLSDFCAIY